MLCVFMYECNLYIFVWITVPSIRTCDSDADNNVST